MVHIDESPAVCRREVLLERDFFAKVEKSDGFWEALGALSTYVEKPLEELEGFARDLCRCCYNEADAIAAGETQLGFARAEVDRLKEKLTQCNLSAMKQLTAAKTQHHGDAEMGGDLITFHEPLQYLEKDTKDLVLTIVNEKVRLLDNGSAPPSLIQALVENANPSAAEPAATDPQVEELAEELEDTRILLQDVRRRAERAEGEAEEAKRAQLEAESRVRAMVKEVEDAKEQALFAKAKLAQAEEKAAEAKRALQEFQARYRELEELSARQQAELERQREELVAKQAEVDRQREELQRQERELERQREEIARVGEELEREREANAAVRKELEREREANCALREQIKKLETDYSALQGRYNVLQKEAEEMREELARRNKTVTQGTQTTLTGTKIDENNEERKRLKVMLEELQMKLKELLEKCKRKGVGDSVAQIAEDLGLQEVLKEKTVFQRLYDDAINRVHRLERLREKVQRERKELLPPSKGSPRPAAGDAEEVPEKSVLDSIGDSKLPGLQGLVKESLLKEKEKERDKCMSTTQLPGMPPSPIAEGAPTPAWALRRNQLAPPERFPEARSHLLPPADRMSSPPPQGAFLGTSPSPQRQMRTTNSLPVLTRTQTSVPLVLLGLNGERNGRSTRTRF